MVRSKARIGDKVQLGDRSKGVVVAVEAVRGSFLGHTSWKDYLSQFKKIKITAAYELDNGKIAVESYYE